MSDPALCTALITIIMMTPMTRPTIACVRIDAAKGAMSSDSVVLGICPTAASDRAPASPIFTGTGMAFVLNGGANAMNTLARMSASMKAETAAASIAIFMVRGSACLTDECGHHVEEVLGERDHLAEHPVSGEHDHERDAHELRHECERLLLDLRGR